MIKSKILAACFLFAFTTMANSMGTLVLLVDASLSIPHKDYMHQIRAYEWALSNVPGLDNMQIEVILFSDKAIKLSSGSKDTAIAALSSHDGDIVRNATCISRGIEQVLADFSSYPKPVVIDISGDGVENCGPDEELHANLDLLESYGATINTLFFAEPTFNLSIGREDFLKNFRERAEEYQRYTRGNGFSKKISSFEDFRYALYDKLVREIAMLN